MQTIPLFLTHHSLRVSAIIDHFGYPSPQLDQWQQHTWYNLGATHDLPHCMRNCLEKGLPRAASPPRVEPPSSPYLPTSSATRPAYGGKFVKASKGGDPPQDVTTAMSSSAAMATPPKNGGKEKEEEEVSNPQEHRDQ